ncbi:MAG: RDD family protein [Bacilli bacterium]|nr:RDD family protein [Bacilli bacterium]
MEKGCPKCGRMVDANLKNCPYCNYDFGEIDKFFEKVDSQKFLEDDKYAGFVKRFVAGMVDLLLIGLISYGLIYLFKFNFYIVFFVSFIILYILINSILERTQWHGSLGKHLVGIEVFDEYENPLTFGASILRNTVKFVNVLTLGLGFLVCSSGEYKQTLGDRITKNYVLNKINYDEIQNMRFSGVLKRFISFIIDSIIIGAVIYVLCSLPFVFSLLKIDMPMFISNYLNSIELILSMVFLFFYVPFFESKNGQTIGKKIIRICVINESGEKLNFPICFIRQFLIVLDILTFGWMLSISNSKKQTLKDLITKTVVVDD